MPAEIALEAALRIALRVMDEHYMVIVSGLRVDGITRNATGVWQLAADHFNTGKLAHPGSDPRMAVADDVRAARAAARKALATHRNSSEAESQGKPDPPRA